MLEGDKISVVIPCYNEEGGISDMLKNRPDFVDEIVVVDNASTDATADVAKRHGAVVVYEPRRGYGSACIAGLKAASGDIIVTTDGDNSVRIEDLAGLIVYKRSGRYDFVVGSRFPLANKDAQPLVNTMANYFISWLIRSLFHVNIRDSQSGIMAFDRKLVKILNPQNIGMGFSQEMKIKAFGNKAIRCGQAHIDYFKRVGKVKFRKSDAYRNLRDAVSLYFAIGRDRVKN